MPERKGFTPKEIGDKASDSKEDDLKNPADAEGGFSTGENESGELGEAKITRVEDSIVKDGKHLFQVSVEMPLSNQTGTEGRIFKFIIPEELQQELYANRPIQSRTINIEQDYALQINHEAAQVGDWNLNPNGTPRMASEYKPGPTEFSIKVDTRSQIFLEMLKDNGDNLSPVNVALMPDKETGGTIFFAVDNNTYEVPFAEAKERVTNLLKKKELFVRAIKEKSIYRNDLERTTLPDHARREIEALRNEFDGLPTRSLKGVMTYGDDFVERYERLKGLQQQRAKGVKTPESAVVDLDAYERYINITQEELESLRPEEKRYRKSVISAVRLIKIFEDLALNAKGSEGQESFAEVALNEAFIKRLKGESLSSPQEAEQKFVAFLNKKESEKEALIAEIRETLVDVSFKRLEDLIGQLPDNKQEAVYRQIVRIFGKNFDRDKIEDEFEFLGIDTKAVSGLDVNKTTARLAMEEGKRRKEKPGLPTYTDEKFFVEDKDGVFIDVLNPNLPFVAKKLIQKGTDKQFVWVVLERKSKPGANKQMKPKFFILPFKDTSIINTADGAIDLQKRVSGIFADRVRSGQPLSFLPYVELVRQTKQDAKFKLTLGESSCEVSYSGVCNSLSFKDKVIAELLKARFIENKKDPNYWGKSSPSEQEAIRMFQRVILCESGLPSITEQLIVEELKRRAGATAPVGAKSKGKVPSVVIKPIGNMSPNEINRIQKLEAGRKIKK